MLKRPGRLDNGQIMEREHKSQCLPDRPVVQTARQLFTGFLVHARGHMSNPAVAGTRLY